MKTLIAPHEGMELTLVVANGKPLCTLDSKKNPKAFAKAQMMVRQDVHCEHTPEQNRMQEDIINETESVFYLKHNEDLAAVHRVLLDRPNLLVKTEHERSRLFGRIFGYTEEEIDAFIEADMQCACGHCLSKVQL